MRIPTSRPGLCATEFTGARIAYRTFSVLRGAHGHGGEELAARADENGTEPRKEEIRFHCISRERGKASIKTP